MTHDICICYSWLCKPVVISFLFFKFQCNCSLSNLQLSLSLSFCQYQQYPDGDGEHGVQRPVDPCNDERSE